LLTALPARLGLLDLGGFHRGLGNSFGGVDELGDAGLDRLVSRELGLGIEIELAFAPVEGADDGVVAGGPFPRSVKEVAEQEVERRRLAIPISERKRTGGALALSGLQ
jgi:hypothetical protein